LGEAPRLRVSLVELVEIARRSAVDRGKRLLDRLGDAEKRQATLEERCDADLVRCVEGTRVGAALLARTARQCQQRKRLQVGELVGPSAAERSAGRGQHE